MLLTQPALFQMGFRSSSASLIDLPSSILYVSGGVPFPRVIPWSSPLPLPISSHRTDPVWLVCANNWKCHSSYGIFVTQFCIDWLDTLWNQEIKNRQVHPNRFDRSLKIVNCPFSFHPINTRWYWWMMDGGWKLLIRRIRNLISEPPCRGMRWGRELNGGHCVQRWRSRWGFRLLEGSWPLWAGGGGQGEANRWAPGVELRAGGPLQWIGWRSRRALRQSSQDLLCQGQAWWILQNSPCRILWPRSHTFHLLLHCNLFCR